MALCYLFVKYWSLPEMLAEMLAETLPTFPGTDVPKACHRSWAIGLALMGLCQSCEFQAQLLRLLMFPLSKTFMYSLTIQHFLIFYLLYLKVSLMHLIYLMLQDFYAFNSWHSLHHCALSFIHELFSFIFKLPFSHHATIAGHYCSSSLNSAVILT